MIALDPEPNRHLSVEPLDTPPPSAADLARTSLFKLHQLLALLHTKAVVAAQLGQERGASDNYTQSDSGTGGSTPDRSNFRLDDTIRLTTEVLDTQAELLIAIEDHESSCALQKTSTVYDNQQFEPEQGHSRHPDRVDFDADGNDPDRLSPPSTLKRPGPGPDFFTAHGPTKQPHSTSATGSAQDMVESLPKIASPSLAVTAAARPDSLLSTSTAPSSSLLAHSSHQDALSAVANPARSASAAPPIDIPALFSALPSLPPTPNPDPSQAGETQPRIPLGTPSALGLDIPSRKKIYRSRYDATGVLQTQSPGALVLAHTLLPPRTLDPAAAAVYRARLCNPGCKSRAPVKVIEQLLPLGLGESMSHAELRAALSSSLSSSNLNGSISYAFNRPVFLLATVDRDLRRDLWDLLVAQLGDTAAERISHKAQLGLLLGVECVGLEEPTVDSKVPLQADRRYCLRERIAIVDFRRRTRAKSGKILGPLLEGDDDNVTQVDDLSTIVGAKQPMLSKIDPMSTNLPAAAVQAGILQAPPEPYRKAFSHQGPDQVSLHQTVPTQVQEQADVLALAQAQWQAEFQARLTAHAFAIGLAAARMVHPEAQSQFDPLASVTQAQAQAHLQHVHALQTGQLPLTPSNRDQTTATYENARCISGQLQIHAHASVLAHELVPARELSAERKARYLNVAVSDCAIRSLPWIVFQLAIGRGPTRPFSLMTVRQAMAEAGMDAGGTCDETTLRNVVNGAASRPLFAVDELQIVEHEHVWMRLARQVEKQHVFVPPHTRLVMLMGLECVEQQVSDQITAGRLYVIRERYALIV
ncbi:hypothetical protein BCR44DRAFT_39907 [Catenaria anguillulae PL171]|uniref:Uncharacterized protein n=1 Tax=Catenaria anguillulae PL171 TaxID=765915 RepID=A0A1Y2HDC0_9FUNG|nr:hypothetical protein BCR44DRAFT_39907 [Catenaria anguillulae PL171]